MTKIDLLTGQGIHTYHFIFNNRSTQILLTDHLHLSAVHTEQIVVITGHNGPIWWTQPFLTLPAPVASIPH